MSDVKNKGKLTLTSNGEKISEEDAKFIFDLSSDAGIEMFKIFQDKVLSKDIDLGIKFSAVEVTFVRMLKAVYDFSCTCFNDDKNLSMEYIEHIFKNARHNIKIHNEIDDANKVLH